MATTYATEVATDSPQVWWRLTETGVSPTFADSSGNGNTGVIQSGAPTLGVVGPLGSAQASSAITVAGFAYLQASGVLLKGYPSTRTSLSIEVWLRFTDTASGFATAQGWDGLGVNAVVNQSSSLVGYITDRNVPFLAVADGRWHHYVVTYDGTIGGGTITTYLDGVRQLGAQSVGTSIHTDAATDVYTVGGGGFDNDFFIGSIAEPAVYPQALTGTRVLAHFEAAGPVNNPAGGGGFQFFNT